MSVHSEEIATDHKEVEYEHEQPRLNEYAHKFLTDLEEEHQRLGDSFPLCTLLIEEAIQRTYSTGRIPGKEYYADVYKQKPIKVTQKVFVPVKQYPKFNFTGKILGPKGNSLRRLQEETQCKIAIKGRNSIRDRAKEEELRNSNDPRYAHLHKDLFIEISTVATPAEGYARVAYALAEIRKYLVPDKNDEVSQEQLRELMEIDPKLAKQFNGSTSHVKRSVFDRKFTSSSGAPKYLSLIKQTAYSTHASSEAEDPEGSYEYDHVTKRAIPAGYSYTKARTVSTTSPYKRPSAPAHASEIKRIRETPVKTYKPNSYGIVKKYK